MPRDHRAPRASRTGTCVRAALFAGFGSVLGVAGHHSVSEEPVPWGLLVMATVAQFAGVWPLARRRYGLGATVLCTLAAQGALHLALSGPAAAAPHHAAGHGAGQAWHSEGTAMTAVHASAAVVVAWLLHRADTRIAKALRGLVARVLPRVPAALVLPEPVRAVSRMGVPMPVSGGVLEYAVVRRGPPRADVP